MTCEDAIKIILAIMIMVTVVTTITLLVRISEIEKDDMCKILGFEAYIRKSGLEYCEDISGNLYYIKKDCDFFELSCSAKQISMGGVRTTNGN